MLGIFAYIEHLFAKIKPKKVFFLAVDGVAPRAKMNQQRSRRFRTAQEAKETLEKAIKRGEEIPESAPFDSNCITPGTAFMQSVSVHLHYFIAKKVSEDANWRNVQVILSGHDVPGEGEHKIMEFIRTVRAQPGYDPNTRHCLYGLDADLIMLGLLSHDPHFALLREEVLFGPQRNRRPTSVEGQTFYLLHLSLVREYLEMEFDDLRDKLPFAFDLEKIIDDYILLHLFVGNDFLPHLPGLHINEGALELLFDIYRRILPRCEGYLNEQGTLRPERLELILQELCAYERQQFVRHHGSGLPGIPQPGKKKKGAARARGKGMVVTPAQHGFVEQVYAFALRFVEAPATAPRELMLPADVSEADRTFLAQLAAALNLQVSFNEYDPATDATATVVSISPEAIAAIEDEEEAHEMQLPEEGAAALQRAAAPDPKATVAGAESEADAGAAGGESTEDAPASPPDEQVLATVHAAEQARETAIDERLLEYKKRYYAEKMNMAYTEDNLSALRFNYLEGIQWVLHYYYDGVASWGWFYRYHYSPQVSDLLNISEYRFVFDLGVPFRPFDQLMGVLPPLSRQILPPAFQPLMVDPNSPILDFYPARYESDLNGKKNSWEAVVKIPFIDERRLLQALESREGGLTEEERSRNVHGRPTLFRCDASFEHTYPSSMPGVLPDLRGNHTRVETFVLPSMHGLAFRLSLIHI